MQQNQKKPKVVKSKPPEPKKSRGDKPGRTQVDKGRNVVDAYRDGWDHFRSYEGEGEKFERTRRL